MLSFWIKIYKIINEVSNLLTLLKDIKRERKRNAHMYTYAYICM